MNEWTRADRWRTELVRTAGAVPIDDIIAFGVALLDELARHGTPHGALHPEVISVRREGSTLRVQIDPKSWPTDPAQETLLATGSKSMATHPGVHYRAPEQFTAQAYDQRADCFAVGVMLYELAAGQLPFGQDSTQSFRVFLALKRGGFPSLRQLRRDIPDALATAITRALALRADERTPDVATMASALRAMVRTPAGSASVATSAKEAAVVKAGPPAPKAVPAPQVASRPAGECAPEPPTPARPTPDRSAVPLDPLRPIETGVLPVATQAAIAAFRADQTGQPAPLIRHRPELVVPTRPRPPEPLAEAGPPIPLGPPAQPAPVVTPTAPATSTAPVPREVSLPVHAIVEAVTRREPPVPAPPRQPGPPVSAPIAAAPVVPRPTPATSTATVTSRPIMMVPPRAVPPSKPIVVAPAPPAPRAPVEPVRERPSERTQVTGPPPQMERQLASRPVEPLRIAPAAPGGIPEPLRVEPALPPSPAPAPVTPRTLPAPRPMQPLAEAGPAPLPRVERPVEPTPQVAPRHAGGQAPAQPTTVAPPPPALVRATVPTAWPPPDAELPAPPVQPPKPATAPPRAPIAAPAAHTPPVAPRPASVSAPAPVAAPDPPREDTAQRSNGEVTPPEGNAKDPPADPTNHRAIVVLSGVLLLLGVGAGLLFRLPSRAAAPAAAPECVPGPERVCPPPEPVAMPEPVVCEPHKPCASPKPSPKVECFYDGYSKGQRRYLRGDRRGALEAFHDAEACMPRNPRLLQWIGRCYEELRERDKAREYYGRYLRRRPRADDADYYHKRLDSLDHPNGGPPRDGGTR